MDPPPGALEAAAVPVVFLCLGSLGDVLPLLAVAGGLGSSVRAQDGMPRYRPHLITHRLYHARLAPFLHASSIAFTGLPFPPLPPPDAGPEHVDAELEACLAACRAAVGQDVPGQALLCANLVAKFAYHIAAVLRLPFILLAPSIPPPGPLPSLAIVRSLVGEDAEGRRVVQRLEEADQHDDTDAAKEPRSVGMAELRHWMLSLLLPSYRALRRRHGLPESFLPSSPQAPLPDAVPLLYGVSPSLHPKPGYFPRSAHFCGCWSIDDEGSAADIGALPLAAGLDDFVPPPADPPALICVDMGSMAEVGMGVDWLALATVAVRAVWTCKRTDPDLRLLLLHFPAEVTLEAVQRQRKGAGVDGQTPASKRARREEAGDEEESPLASWVRILPREAFVPHATLFPRCRAVAHHGGLGTTVACIRHGSVPQFVLPCTEEQALWGEVVAYKGMGLTAGLSLLRGSEEMTDVLASFFARLLDEGDEMRVAARRCREAMVAEDGVGRAVALVEEYVQLKLKSKRGNENE